MQDFLLYERQATTKEEEVHDILHSAISRSAKIGQGGPRDLDSIPLGPVPKFGELINAAVCILLLQRNQNNQLHRARFLQSIMFERLKVGRVERIIQRLPVVKDDHSSVCPR